MTTTDTPEATKPALQQEAALHIPLGLLAPSPTNPRRKFDQAKLEELAEGIKELGGVFQPILARPNPAHREGNGQPPYEIVAGERRWRASKIAGMTTLLALVRPLSDRLALQIQLKENVDRESLHELEEAEGIKRLMTETGTTVDEVAHMLNKGRRWVFGRLALLNLCPAAREAFLADKFKATVAGLLATIPDHSEQAAATASIVQGFGGEPYSFRSAAEFLRKEYMLKLASAPFDITATFDVAGPCGQCSKRTGANPDLFGDDVKAGDMCQDRSCFRAKEDEAHERKLEAARAAGHTILVGADARKLMPSPTYLPLGYYWFDQPLPALTADPRPLREIFGSKQRDVLTLDMSSSGVISLVPEASAKKLLKTKGLLRPQAPIAPPPRISDAAAAAPQAQAPAPAPSGTVERAAPAAAPQPTPARVLANMSEARAGKLFGQAVFKRIREGLQASQVLPVKALCLLILARLDDTCSAEGFELLYTGHGWELPSSEAGHHATYLADVEHRLNDMGPTQLGELLIETLVIEELTDHSCAQDVELSDWLNAPTYSLMCELGIEHTLGELEAAADEQGFQEVRDEEAKRMGHTDATSAFVQAHAPSKTKAPVKYRNAMTGETWSGRGLQPKWMKVAIADGARLEDFVVSGA